MNQEILLGLQEAMNKGLRGVLITVIDARGSTPGKVGDKLLMLEDGRRWGTVGGGKVEFQALQEIAHIGQRNVPWRRRFKLIEDQGMLCGGQMELLFEPVGMNQELIIFGAGHIGRVLCELAARAGFRVTVIDNRSEYAVQENLPGAHKVFCAAYEKAAAELTTNESSFIVVVTHGHVSDAEIIRRCLAKPFAYLGVIGSRSKTRKIKQLLSSEGFSEEQLQQLHMPIGLDIGAQTPFEIAVSILAEMIAVRAGVDITQMSIHSKKSATSVES